MGSWSEWSAMRRWSGTAEWNGTVDVQLAFSARPLARYCRERRRRDRVGDSSARWDLGRGVSSRGCQWCVAPAGAILNRSVANIEKARINPGAVAEGRRVLQTA